MSLSFCRGSRVEGRGFHVEGEGTMSRVYESIFLSRVEGSMSRARVPCRESRVIFFFLQNFFLGKGNNRCSQCH